MTSGVYLRTEEHKQRISQAISGNNNSMKRSKTRDKISGKNSNLWKGGKSSEDQCERARFKSRSWSKAVKERDNYTCQHCGIQSRTKVMCAHHIRSWRENEDLRYDVNNGITLCRSCHRKVHYAQER